ncbi:hypothetical protein E1262_04530 [Jiangella aurantiaca]|uniref:Membrane lipoprotein n=1 Tax=Jiangella aurantiaca TaxID=2530373 RepID=A0A4R5AH40_9ACTN|nr:hypothetical protein [Jiangella aurantiaca]TDD71988.1 hypothetical protein E1262_04530 [Jiangella aurantiaca]
MKPSRRWVLVLLLPPAVSLAACASGPADADELADRAASVGVDPEVVYAVSLDGFEPVSQSVGVYGEAGFGVAYASSDGGMAMLTTDPRGMTDADCRAADGCTPDGDGWYRVSGDQHEYVALHDGVAVALEAPVEAVDEDTLRSAVAGAHPPSADELAALFEQVPDGGGAPVERGDLPPAGDGAPVDSGGSGAAG